MAETVELVGDRPAEKARGRRVHERATPTLTTPRGIAWGASVLVLLLAAADAWSWRHQINADGISYLDIGDTVFAHGIKAGANISRSPLYTWVLGAALSLVHPPRPHELIVVMAVNVVIVAVLLVAFAWWLRELSALLRAREARPLIPERLQVLLAYGVLAWLVLRGLRVTLVTPDMLLAAVAFAAVAVLVRIARLGGSLWNWLGLGALLGIGYLTKAAFVAPALIGLAVCAVLTAGRAARRLAAVTVAVAACVSVSAPYVAALSSKEGRLEVGGYASLNYAWFVDGVTQYLNWTGENGEFGRPLHPTEIAASPPTFAYPSPIAGSIPPWYDPSYWYEGVHPRFMLGGQLYQLALSVYATLHAVVIGPLILVLALMLVLWRVGAGQPRRAPASAHSMRATSRRRQTLRALASHCYLALPIVGLLAYWPLGTSTRYVAAYLGMLAVTSFMLLCARRPRPDVRPAVIDRVGLVTVLVVASAFVWSAIPPIEHVTRQLTGADAPGTSHLRVARALTRAGLGDGDRIAFLGDPAEVLVAYWARLDRARVVGDIDDRRHLFWQLPPAAQARALALLRARSGARVVVTDEPVARSAPGWTAIAGTADSYRVIPWTAG
jgi:4-amino-4-deoxy-L-arabinose transferase-like glycosyltransferase